MKEFIIENWDTILALIGGIISFLWGVYCFFIGQKQKVTIELLKTKLEIQKSQGLLNDSKFRRGYENFLDLLLSEIHKEREMNATEEGMTEVMKIAILFAGPDTIRTFAKYRKNANKLSGDDNILVQTEKLLLCMRNDLGVSNEGLKQYDILQTLIVGDIKEALVNEINNDE